MLCVFKGCGVEFSCKQTKFLFILRVTLQNSLYVSLKSNEHLECISFLKKRLRLAVLSPPVDQWNNLEPLAAMCMVERLCVTILEVYWWSKTLSPENSGVRSRSVVVVECLGSLVLMTTDHTSVCLSMITSSIIITV